MKIAVVADDLTGANVNGALLAAKGFSSATCLECSPASLRNFAHCAAVAYSTDSRLLPAARAWDKVFAAIEVFRTCTPALLAKRIDSTLRGNVGAEIDAALSAMDAAKIPDEPDAVAVVVAAYPASGRILRDGCLMVHGVPLEKSPFAADPATPVVSSSASGIIAEQTKRRIGHISLSQIRAGENAVRGKALALQQAGKSILVCDAATDEDIQGIAGAFADAPFPILAVDPGPFTAELAARRISPEAGTNVIGSSQRNTTHSKGRVLAVIGSVSELARSQMEILRGTHPACIVRLDWRKLFNASSRQTEISRVIRLLAATPMDCGILGVCMAEKEEDVFSHADLAARMGLCAEDISGSINSALAEIARKILEIPELAVQSVFSSGGEVTVSVMRALGGQGFTIEEEVLPLAVFGRLAGGEYSGLPWITKGGFVGDAHSLVLCMERLFARMSTIPGQMMTTVNVTG